MNPPAADEGIAKDAAARARALFVLSSDRMGGAERIVRAVALAAARHGQFRTVEVLVLCWAPSCGMEAELLPPNVQVTYLRGKTKFSGVLRGAVWLFRHRRRRYELAFSSIAFVNALLSISRRLGILRTGRLVARESTIGFERFKGFERWMFSMLYRFYGTQDMVVCQTERMRLSISRHTRGRLDHLLVVLANPLCRRLDKVVDRDAGNVAADELRLVWCGRFCRVKAPMRAIRALEYLLREGIGARLVMIGDGEELPAARKMVNERGLAEQVCFVGHVSDPLAHMGSCDIGMVTSDYEGFPNVVLEMLASGVGRIVSTNCAGGLEEVPGLIVADGTDPFQVAAAVKSARHARVDRPAIDDYLQRHSIGTFFESVSGLRVAQ